MIRKILIGVAILVAVFAAVVYFQPSDFQIARTTTIAAPARTVFDQVNDLREWDNWSPWTKLDPAAKVSFEGARRPAKAPSSSGRATTRSAKA